MADRSFHYVLLFSCLDRPGIVHEVAGVIAGSNSNIEESAQFSEPQTNRFCMRIHFSSNHEMAVLHKSFETVSQRFGMQWQLFDLQRPARIVVMMSKVDHCILDLIYKRRSGDLPVDIVAVISNHAEFTDSAAQAGIPFHHLPVTAQTKPQQEQQVLGLIEQYEADFVVLARYMQVLSDDLCERLSGRVINIHHSFLPGFKGARPYHQAHARGVKLIGATAHFVTSQLDEGPIIEQGVERVDHSHSPQQLAAVGRDIERQVLSRAVRYHAEHRVLLIGNKTVVFH